MGLESRLYLVVRVGLEARKVFVKLERPKGKRCQQKCLVTHGTSGT